MTNWYSIFYWLTVADEIKNVTQGIGIFTSILTFIALIGMFVSGSYLSSEISSYNENTSDAKSWKVWRNNYSRAFFTFIIIATISWIINIFVPSKKDALIIIAGGAVGNFVTRDSTTKQLPADVMLLLRSKIKEEINNTSLKDALSGETDTLKDKSKEELLQIIKRKNN